MNPRNTISQYPKDSLFIKCEIKSFNTIVMPVMVIEVIDLGEELASMKAMLERILKRIQKSSFKMNRLLT